MSFVISSIPKSSFEHLFALSSAELPTYHAVRMVATENPGFPCRVSLADAEIGEEVILVNYEHQSVDSPFRASHGVFVRSGVEQARPSVNEVPQMLRSRVLSLRGFDDQGMMLAADLIEGTVLESGLEELFRNDDVAYVHIHFAKPGCYAARADRA